MTLAVAAVPDGFPGSRPSWVGADGPGAGRRAKPAADGAEHGGLPDVPERRLIRRVPSQC
jgi:hypothetical protein